MTTDLGLPPAWRLALTRGTRRLEDGRVLIGGTPLRVMRLSDTGAGWLGRLAAGEPLGAGVADRQMARRLVDSGVVTAHPPPQQVLGSKDVSVVIPVRDEAAGLRRTLDALGEVAGVVVVDDGSREPVRIADRAGSTLLRNERSEGPAAARQRGWAVAETTVVAFVDADVVPDPGWLAPLLAHFDDPVVGAVAPRIVPRSGSRSNTVDRYEQARFPLDMGERPGLVRPGAPVAYVPSTLLLVRTDALRAVGGFATELRVGEDVDLVWRLNNAGWRVAYEPAVRASHPTRPDRRSWLRQRWVYGTSAAELARRHGDAAAPLRLSPWTAATSLALLFRRPFAALGLVAALSCVLASKLAALRHPWREAARMVARGNVHVLQSSADAMRRPWWPVAVLVAVVSRRARPVIVGVAIVPPALQWLLERPPLDPVRYGLMRAADDLAYGAGVWSGCLRVRSFRALIPTGPRGAA